MPHLDVAETADLLRDRRDGDRQMVVVGIELGQELRQGRLVVGDELALGAALGPVAERIEGGATQELEPHQQPEQRQQPRPEGDLARQPGAAIAPRQERRGEMELEAQAIAIEFLRDLAAELAIAVEPRYLV